MEIPVLALSLVFFLLLALEQRRAKRDRQRLEHVVYVNGTRGKSSVTRLIDAGLRAGGRRCFCKTTGTLPMTIDIQNRETQLRRRGPANIREQLDILHRAAREGAQVLVLECMAVDPVLQAVSQHRMVKADVGVITNVRLDHTDRMGPTLPAIAQALSNTIPRNGLLFTAEVDCFGQLSQNARALGAQIVQALPGPGLEGPLPDFPENVALALAVCERLGVDRQTALEGMKRYRRDPYALSAWELEGGAIFVNGMSANDPQSTLLAFERAAAGLDLEGRRLILLLNSRRDRPERTAQLAGLAEALSPDELWLVGPGSALLARCLKGRGGVPPLRRFGGRNLPVLRQAGPGAVVFAAGNIAGCGRALMEQIEREGARHVL